MSIIKRLFGGRSGASTPVGAYGYAADNPILCDGPGGERAYIARLRCSSGHRLQGDRAGSFSGKCPDPANHEKMFDHERPENGCLVDGYPLTCEGGEHKCFLFFDMYHATAVEREAPEGLLLVAASEAEVDSELFLQDQHPVSQRFAILEETNGVAWLYLTAPGEQRPEKDALVYSLGPLVTTDEAIAAARAGGPPPLSVEFASAEAVIAECLPEDVRFVWSADGGSVAVLRRGQPMAMIVGGAKRGHSKALGKDGPYGSPWDAAVYEAYFGGS